MARRLLGTLVVFVASAFVVGSSFPAAQSAPPQRFQITIVNVKPDALTDWLALQQKETIPALKKIGAVSRDAWTTSIFGTGFEYVFVAPIEKFANYDNPQGPFVRALGQEGARIYNDKVRKMIASQQTLAITMLPESIMPPPSYQPKFLVLNFSYVTPGRADEFLAFWRNELMPVLRKAKPVGYALSRTLHGGDANEFAAARYLEKMADLDAPPLPTQVLGAEAAAKLAPKPGVVQRQERRIYRYVPELSFGPATSSNRQ